MVVQILEHEPVYSSFETTCVNEVMIVVGVVKFVLLFLFI